MFLLQPLPGAVDFQSRAIDQHMQRAVRQRPVSCGWQLPRLRPAQRRMIGDGHIKPHEIQQRVEQSLGLAQPHSEDATQRQRRFDGEIGIPGLAASGLASGSPPPDQCLRRYP